MDAKLYIAIACYNRRRLADLRIPAVRVGMAPGDCLAIYGEGSHEKVRERHPHAYGKEAKLWL